MATAPLVIGIGNPDRGDDGIGRHVAGWLRELSPPGLDVAEAGGDPTRLLELLADRPEVWLIDAAASGAAPGTLHDFDANAGPIPVKLGGPSSHGLGAADAIELARTLGALPGRCTVFTIEGASFETGAPLSPAVEAAGRGLVQRFATALARPEPS